MYMKRLRTHSPDAADAAMMATFSGMEIDLSILDHVQEDPAITHDILEAVW
jgi:hypothetical protein